jgi:hypothetical protein
MYRIAVILGLSSLTQKEDPVPLSVQSSDRKPAVQGRVSRQLVHPSPCFLLNTDFLIPTCLIVSGWLLKFQPPLLHSRQRKQESREKSEPSGLHLSLATLSVKELVKEDGGKARSSEGKHRKGITASLPPVHCIP